MEQIFPTKSLIMNAWRKAGLDLSRSAPGVIETISFKTWNMPPSLPIGDGFFSGGTINKGRQFIMWRNKNRPTVFALQWRELWQEDTLYRSTGWLIPPFISSPLPSAPFHKYTESSQVLLFPAVFVQHSSAAFSPPTLTELGGPSPPVPSPQPWPTCWAFDF